MNTINCPSCGEQLHPLANFCGTCRRTLFQSTAIEPRAKLGRIGPAVFVFGLFLLSAMLVLAFFQLRARQKRDDALATSQNGNAGLLKPLRNRNPGQDQASQTQTGAPSDSRPETGAHGLPRDLTGPTGDEAQALSALKAILSAEMAYFAETAKGYATFDELVAHHYLKPVFRSERPIVAGYSFTLSVLGSTDAKRPSFSFHVNADPVTGTGRRHFYMDDTGSIHFNVSGPATDKDPFEQYQ